MSNRKTNKNKSIPPKFAGGVEKKGARKDKKKKIKIAARFQNAIIMRALGYYGNEICL